ncbi:MAG: protein phosphatase 2C domain-containing protein [Oscillospiraceae bacterium]|jgi:protein phosphatase|nr:protein phosphatase 2C domain-containing protein [Oscillospiraceae bacterium]
MKLFTKTDIGLKRHENQDRVWAGNLPGGGAAIVLCDGMGGELAGSYAAQAAVDYISSEIAYKYREDWTPSAIKKLLVTALGGANAEVYSESVRNIERRGMGTTCVAGIITPDTAYIINAGDSRAYHIFDENMTRVTRDHTYVRRLVDNGLLDEENARRHPQRNCITCAIGADEYITPDFFAERVRNDSMFLFCSDGVHGITDDYTIAQIVGANSIDDICAELVANSIACGGHDNITVALCVNT